MTQEQVEEWEKEFDATFKCIQGDCDGNGHIPYQMSEDDWSSKQCQFHAEYIFPIILFIRTKITEAEERGARDMREKLEAVTLVDGFVGFTDEEFRGAQKLAYITLASLPLSEEDWRESKSNWKCACGMSLPYWGAKMDDGNLRCQECKRVYSAPDVLLSEEEKNQHEIQ